MILLYCLLLCSARGDIFPDFGFGGNKLSRKFDAHEDVINVLPGISPQPTFAQYSGYLQGSTPNYQLHYWFVEAVENPQNAPLLLWLNGGPGCSSMEGFLSENGPYTVKAGGLEYNPYSWNKFANMLYLESPAGVGYSYAVDNNITTDDDFASLNNYHALLHFLKKFPAYRDRDFYITGESYAGVYVPTLAIRVLQDKNNGLNLKGIAVGNALLSYRLNDNSQLYFLNYHGLIDESRWTDALSNCCGTQCAAKCMFTDDRSTPCQMTITELSATPAGLDAYNLYNLCPGGVPTEVTQTRKSTARLDMDNLFRGKLIRQIRNVAAQPVSKKLDLPCVDDTAIRTYMNRADVRRALHASSRAPTEWNVCDEDVNKKYDRKYQDLSQAYLKVLNSSVNVMLYAGDVDTVCNFLGILWFVDDLGLRVEKPMATWFYHEADGTRQVGGLHKLLLFGQTKLWYATIRGAGHMVPEDKPIPMYQLITRFIANANL